MYQTDNAGNRRFFVMHELLTFEGECHRSSHILMASEINLRIFELSNDSLECVKRVIVWKDVQISFEHGISTYYNWFYIVRKWT